MRFAFDIAIAFLVAVVTGVSSAWFAVDHAPLFNGLRVGAWTAWPRAAGSDADPYDRAAAVRNATLALGSAEGLAFTAVTDDAGALLDGRCLYSVAGETPAARLWTLTAYDQRGRLMAGPAGPSSLSSREILRRPNGSFEIALAPTVQPGNWLPATAAARITLVLRLYDTPLTSTARPATPSMPAIRKLACR